LHENNIVHRDIKPDNIMMKDDSENPEIKLIDFGLSNVINNGRKLETIVGTPYYLAPEIIQ